LPVAEVVVLVDGVRLVLLLEGVRVDGQLAHREPVVSQLRAPA
jgi:hypothetical protein